MQVDLLQHLVRSAGQTEGEESGLALTTAPLFAIDTGFSDPNYKQQTQISYVLNKMKEAGNKTTKGTDFIDHFDLLPPLSPETEQEAFVWALHRLVRAGLFDEHKEGHCVSDHKFLLARISQALYHKFQYLKPDHQNKERYQEVLGLHELQSGLRMADIGALVKLMEVLLNALMLCAKKTRDYEFIDMNLGKQRLVLDKWSHLKKEYWVAQAGLLNMDKEDAVDALPWIPRLVVRCDEVVRIKNVLCQLHELKAS